MKYTFDLDMFKMHLGNNCPCKLHSPDNICPCEEFREAGKCSCGLFKEVKNGR